MPAELPGHIAAPGKGSSWSRKMFVSVYTPSNSTWSEGPVPEICEVFGISERTLRYWCRNYREHGVEGLRDESRRPHRSPNRIHGNLANRILQLRRRHPAWGAMRIHAVLARRGVRVSWRTVHRVLQRHGFMVRVVKKPKPFKRFQRHHVDSLWQMDTYSFRIAGVVGKVYVVTILDDRSRYLVMARAYRHERAREAVNALWWALKGGRRPKAVYVDNGSCFISKEFPELLRGARHPRDLREPLPPPRAGEAGEVPRNAHPGTRRTRAVPLALPLPSEVVRLSRSVRRHTSPRWDRLEDSQRSLRRPKTDEQEAGQGPLRAAVSPVSSSGNLS